MSGHSKWSTIKRAKGITDAKRGTTFTKIANAITLAARSGGGGDPEMNPKLRLPLEQARQNNMPKENIQRAIDRGLGKLPGQTLEEVIYEGFGPAKVAFLLEAFTDNKMRTLAELKNLFDRSGGALGANGSTAYMFDKKGELKVTTKGGEVEDEILELIDLGALDVEEVEEDSQKKYLVDVGSTELNSVSKNITQSGFSVESAEIIFKPNLLTPVTDKEQAEKVIAFTEKLEENDDIQKVYANFDIPENLL